MIDRLEPSSPTAPPVQQATPFNFDLRYWGSMLIGTLVGGIPIGLFWAWFRLARGQRREGHNQG